MLAGLATCARREWPRLLDPRAFRGFFPRLPGNVGASPRVPRGTAFLTKHEHRSFPSMTRALAATGIAVALALSGCKPTPPGPKKSGPAVAQGEGVIVTVDEFKARLDEQSPFIRAALPDPGAEEGVPRQPDPLRGAGQGGREGGARERPRRAADALKKVMVQKLVQKTLRTTATPRKELPDAERPEVLRRAQGRLREAGPRARLAAVVLVAGRLARTGPRRAPRRRSSLAQVKTDEKKNPQAFQARSRDLVRRRRHQGRLAATSASGPRTSSTKQFGEPSPRPPSPSRTARTCVVETAAGLLRSSGSPAGRRGSPAPSTR